MDHIGQPADRVDTAHPLPNDTGQARDAIERTRGRISETLDQIEGRLVSKKEQIKARADVTRPVREQVTERPFQAIGVALGAGLLLGMISGGDDEDELDIPDEDERREIRARRRARSMRMRERFADFDEDFDRPSRSRSRGPVSSTMRSLGRTAMHQVGGALAGALAAAIQQRVSGASSAERPSSSRSTSFSGDGRSERISRDTGFHS